MRIFVTGATGFIGGSVAQRLAAAGHQVRGLARSRDKADRLETFNIEPVMGDLADIQLLAGEAKGADAVINAANADDLATVQILINALRSSGKALIHTSGSSIVGDESLGEPSDIVHSEPPANPVAGKAARVAIDRSILDAASSGIRSVVICPSMIYGEGKGPTTQSQQVPMLLRHAKEARVSCHVGRGLNRWSHVHIADVAELYLLALDKAQAGSFYYAENGESTLLEIARDIARHLNVAGPEPVTFEEAVKIWGRPSALYGLGSNSRVRADRARSELGWNPRESSIFHDLPREAALYR